MDEQARTERDARERDARERARAERDLEIAQQAIASGGPTPRLLAAKEEAYSRLALFASGTSTVVAVALADSSG